MRRTKESQRSPGREPAQSTALPSPQHLLRIDDIDALHLLEPLSNQGFGRVFPGTVKLHAEASCASHAGPAQPRMAGGGRLDSVFDDAAFNNAALMMRIGAPID